MGQEAVAYLLRNGVTEAAVAAAFSLCGDKDACQSLPTQRQVASVAAFLRAECGLADADVAKALNRSPRVLLLELASMRQKVVLLGKWLKAPGELAAAVPVITQVTARPHSYFPNHINPSHTPHEA